MTLFFPAKRATLLYPSGPPKNPGKKHLYILLTDPVTDEKLVLMVGVSSVNPDGFFDPACCLYTGDHEFIRHKSYVNYRMARIESSTKLERGVKENKFIPQGALDSRIYARVCNGMLESRFVTPKIMEFFQTHTDNE